MANIESLFTHSIQDQGVSFEVSFTVRILLESGDRHWHYYGVTEAELPRADLEPNVPELANAPFTEHAVVKFPQSFNDLPGDMLNELYSLAVPAGLNREGAW
jgi:hypothetical protein